MVTSSSVSAFSASSVVTSKSGVLSEEVFISSSSKISSSSSSPLNILPTVSFTLSLALDATVETLSFIMLILSSPTFSTIMSLASLAFSLAKSVALLILSFILSMFSSPILSVTVFFNLSAASITMSAVSSATFLTFFLLMVIVTFVFPSESSFLLNSKAFVSSKSSKSSAFVSRVSLRFFT